MNLTNNITVEEPPRVMEHTPSACYTTWVEQHAKYMEMIHWMLCVLRERQSSWTLTDEERKHTKEGIKALEAAKDALSVQIYA